MEIQFRFHTFPHCLLLLLAFSQLIIQKICWNSLKIVVLLFTHAFAPVCINVQATIATHENKNSNDFNYRFKDIMHSELTQAEIT